MKLQTAKPVTPSEEVMELAKKEFVIKDSKGRAIVIQRPNWLKQSNFIRVLGSKALLEDGRLNSAYIDSISSILYVKSLDGVSVTFNNDLEVDKWLNELDIEGKIAVEEAVIQNFFKTTSQMRDDVKK